MDYPSRTDVQLRDRAQKHVHWCIYHDDAQPQEFLEQKGLQEEKRRDRLQGATLHKMPKDTDYQAFGEAQRKRYEDYKSGKLSADEDQKIRDILNNPNGFCTLIKKAKTLGIPIVPMDKFEFRSCELSDRVEKMNAFAASQVAGLFSTSSAAKPLIIVGELHATDCIIGEKSHTGLSEMLGLPAVSVSTSVSTSYSSLPVKPFCSDDVGWREPLPYQLGINTQKAKGYEDEQEQIGLEERDKMNQSLF